MKQIYVLLLLVGFGFTQALAQEKIDYQMINRIKQEGLKNSQIEMIASYLTDVSGPRLTNSPGLKSAEDWAVKTLTSWGLTNSKLEAWGEFGKGWRVDKSYVAMTSPYYMPFIAIPKAWTGSTNGAVSGEVILLKVEKEEDLDQYKGKLTGKIVLFPSSYDASSTFEADGNRYTDEELKELEKYPTGGAPSRYTPELIAQYRARRALQNKISEFLISENAAVIISGKNGRHGTFFTSNGAPYQKDATVAGAEFEMATEHTNLMERILEKGIPVKLEAEIKTTFFEDDLQGYNVIAEIQGTDKKLKEEVVMLGGHLDSWHAGTGATDNAAGCAVMMEAVRILKATGYQPKRTIRIALWTGEEQGIYGSRNYVKNHFGDSETMNLKSDHSKLSAYYNIDNGTGRIRGVYLQENEAARPIFNDWFNALSDIIETPTISVRNTGGTDHLAFDGVSIPGFQFIQDDIEYNTRTHHSNMDVYERLEMDDLKQMATVIAAIVYHTAERTEMMPRKPLKKVENSTR